MKKKGLFKILIEKSVCWSGSCCAVILAFAVVGLWIITGPLFGYSDSWQMVINTITNIVTFLLVFLIQSSHNRDSKSIQIKLAELIRVTKGAHTSLIDLENLTDQELSRIYDKYARLAKEARRRIIAGRKDTHVPEVNFKS
jgi:low affinity Fe/Cu permease